MLVIENLSKENVVWRDNRHFSTVWTSNVEYVRKWKERAKRIWEMFEEHGQCQSDWCNLIWGSGKNNRSASEIAVYAEYIKLVWSCGENESGSNRGELWLQIRKVWGWKIGHTRVGWTLWKEHWMKWLCPCSNAECICTIEKTGERLQMLECGCGFVTFGGGAHV